MNPFFYIAVAAAYWLGRFTAPQAASAAAPTLQPAAKPLVLNPPNPTVVAAPNPAPAPAPNPTAAPAPTLNIPPGWTPIPENPTQAVLDAAFNELPDDIRDAVKTAYTSGTSPDKLDELATKMEADYPLVAAALHNKARQLRAASSASVMGARRR